MSAVRLKSHGNALGAEILGLPELQRRARRLDERLRRRVYNRAVKDAGKGIAEDARSRAPFRTGGIKRHVVVRSSSKPSRFLFGVKVTVSRGLSSSRTARRRGRGASYHPDAVDRYYRFQELGTMHHPAKAFLLPAIKANSGQVMNTLRRSLSAALERETRAL